MELSYEEYRLMKKDLRRRLSVVGWILLAYYGIMNASVFLWAFVQGVISAMSMISAGNLEDLEPVMMDALESAGGYFLAAAIGLLILLLWKKPRFWKNQIWAKGKPMKPVSFLCLLSLFVGGQLVYQLVMIAVELILNAFGLSVVAGMEAVSMDTGNFGMFLYGGILAPVTEELLFRGLVQRTVMPYGKRFAIVISAFTFGIFHGNLLQAPYAFLVGLVLGYVACEYSIGWAMVLHMINNLVLGDMMPRLTSGMGDVGSSLVFWGVLVLSGIGAIVSLIMYRKEIAAFRRENPIHGTYLSCFFSCAGSIIFMILMAVSMVASIFVMVTPM